MDLGQYLDLNIFLFIIFWVKGANEAKDYSYIILRVAKVHHPHYYKVFTNVQKKFPPNKYEVPPKLIYKI